MSGTVSNQIKAAIKAQDARKRRELSEELESLAKEVPKIAADWLQSLKNGGDKKSWYRKIPIDPGVLGYSMWDPNKMLVSRVCKMEGCKKLFIAVRKVGLHIQVGFMPITWAVTIHLSPELFGKGHTDYISDED